MYNLIHVHVGKCAGSSINQALNKSRICFSELHCGDADSKLKSHLDNDDGANVYLISARDPIKRFVSAFNWDKFEKIINKKSNNPYWKNIYETFCSVNHLVESLGSGDEYGRLADFALKNSQLHMQLGLSWYIPVEVLEKLPVGRTFLVRTESLLCDFNLFLQEFYPGKSMFEQMPKDKDSSGFLDCIGIDNPKYLSAESELKLRKYLDDDYKILNHLIGLNQAYKL
ncbi:sulfotransferase family 2 domain-containing protein [Amphritea pacifica]|uniref:Sulfotransferase family protein n=1 Tax=Amphritea pacifica TaxID=2811233 RepID=A0ABS2W637_9GAMM|nr:sulfotransferase family 2 domain-containing protein [Amphritea pacifica]MBN0987013.1 hypothetical protein [Amphritea pacifica]